MAFEIDIKAPAENSQNRGSKDEENHRFQPMLRKWHIQRGVHATVDNKNVD
jgi:hypothetical protein